MRAIFAAVGPSIHENKEIPEFENIELYNLFAGNSFFAYKPLYFLRYANMAISFLQCLIVVFFIDLLQIQPAPNNGTKGHLYSVLKYPPAFVETIPIPEPISCIPNVQVESCDAGCPVSWHCPFFQSFDFAVFKH